MVPLMRVALVLILLTFSTGSAKDNRQCRKKYEKIGCFHDRVVPDRPLTIQLLNRMDKYSKAWDGQLIDWKHYEETLYKLACKCAELTIKRGYQYFGLQFFGQCWSGPRNESFSRDGPSDECQGGKFAVCNDKSKSECIGKCFTNYVYKVHKEYSSGGNITAPIDGGWSEWGQWSKCSSNCPKNGNDVRIRGRNCTNPSPANGGKRCSKSNREFQTQTCVSPECIEWSRWTSWSSCEASRIRVCHIKGTKKEAKGCPGKDEETKTCQQCNQAQWTKWSAWGTCSATCGPKASRQRVRQCILFGKVVLRVGFCKGKGIEVEVCKVPSTCPQWSKWSAWGACSATCGLNGVTRTRSRQCLLNGANRPTKDCPGPPVEIQKCKLNGCPQWGSWSGWFSCSKTCGRNGVFRSRNRKCFIEGTRTVTTGCPGSATGVQACNLPGCPQWSKWSPWGACSKTCGLTGVTRTRSRKCVQEGSNVATTGCPGSNSNSEACPPKRCPCDCTAEDRKPKPVCAIFRNGKLPFGSECEFIKFACNLAKGVIIEKTSFAVCKGLNIPF